MDDKKFERRDFLKKWMKGSAIFLAVPVLNACKDEWLYPLYYVRKEDCTGCGKCLAACYYSAIILPKLSSYAINSKLLIVCGFWIK